MKNNSELGIGVVVVVNGVESVDAVGVFFAQQGSYEGSCWDGSLGAELRVTPMCTDIIISISQRKTFWLLRDVLVGTIRNCILSLTTTSRMKDVIISVEEKKARYLHISGMKSSQAYVLNGIAMFLGWLVARIVFFGLSSYHVYNHIDLKTSRQSARYRANGGIIVAVSTAAFA
ncbi:transmembrane protein 56 [Artemisia annua]|uniref:Transmembrane protein 56 n=1 Tax=Artemisia annua TaxID=35608 RepID=A0A2U1MPL8_ARTAN|nr:transmembrane protein 56 [Artemisia annua]